MFSKLTELERIWQYERKIEKKHVNKDLKTSGTSHKYQVLLTDMTDADLLRTGATSPVFGCPTLLTVGALVGWTAYADSLNARAVVGAGGVDALTFLHVTLCPLPPGQAHTPSFLVHPVPAAQHRARICGTERRRISAAHSGGRACKHALARCGRNLLREGPRSLITVRPQNQQILDLSASLSLAHMHAHSHMQL